MLLAPVILADSDEPKSIRRTNMKLDEICRSESLVHGVGLELFRLHTLSHSALAKVVETTNTNCAIGLPIGRQHQ